MLFDTLQADYITAFKARDAVRKDALNFVIAQLKNKKIELQKDLEDADVVSVLKKEVKSRQEAITYLVQAGNTEEQAREEGIIAVLESYLPQMMSQDALTEIVEKIVADAGITDFQKGRGEIVKAVMAEHKAVVDGKMLQDVINGMIG
jgi:uncharacterized protein